MNSSKMSRNILLEEFRINFDEKTKEQKLWAKRSYQTADLLVTFNYVLGALPVYWNRKLHKMELIKSAPEQWRWLLTSWLTIVLEVAYMFGYSVKFFWAQDSIKYLKDNIVQSGVFLMCGIFILTNLHTLWKYKLFACFINHAAGFYEHFQNSFAKKQEAIGCTIEDNISGLVKLTFFLGSIFLVGGTTLASVFRCDYHFLFNVLPICDENSDYISLAMLPCLAIFQAYFVAVNCGSLFLYVDLFAAVVLMGLYIVEQMTESWVKESRTISKLHINHHWFKTFRCVHLIVTELNDTIGDAFMPIHMIVLMFATSFAIFITIKFNSILTPDVIGIIICYFILNILYYTMLICKGSKFSEYTEVALLSRKWFVRTKYDRTVHRTCPSLRPKVGIFFPFRKHTVLAMLQTCLDITVQLLLL